TSSRVCLLGRGNLPRSFGPGIAQSYRTGNPGQPAIRGYGRDRALYRVSRVSEHGAHPRGRFGTVARERHPPSPTSQPARPHFDGVLAGAKTRSPTPDRDRGHHARLHGTGTDPFAAALVQPSAINHTAHRQAGDLVPADFKYYDGSTNILLCGDV